MCLYPALSLDLKDPQLRQLHPLSQFAITSVIRDKAASGSFCLERLNLAWSEVEFNTSALVLSGDRYLNWFFPNFGGHYVAAAGRGMYRFYPFFYLTIEAPQLKVVIF